MNKILYLYPKHLENKKFFKKLASKNKKGKFLFIEQSKKKKILQEVVDSTVLINCPRTIFKEVFNKANKLNWVHTGAAGIEEYLFPEFVKSNIIFTNGKILQGPSMADHAIGILLGFTRNLFLNYKNIKLQERPIELKNKNCGILGIGGSGMLIAERLKTFGMNVYAFNDESVPFNSFYKKVEPIERISKYLKDLDVVISCVPFTRKTKDLINFNFLKKMKKNSILINISRGQVLETKALLKNKIFKKFKGIGLDVTYPEPLNLKHKLRGLSNVLLTNHTSGHSDKNRARSLSLIEINVNRYLLNLDLINEVDKKKGF